MPRKRRVAKVPTITVNSVPDHLVAWFSGEERIRGSLAAGQMADLAVLSGDYFGVDEDAIPELRSELTIVGGRIVHAGEPFAGLAVEVNAAH